MDVERYLLDNLSYINPEDPGRHGYGSGFRILRSSGVLPCPGLLDLARMAVEPELVLHFNPFFSPEAHRRWNQGVSVWLQLCVLEDRLERMDALLRLGKEFEPTLLRVGKGLSLKGLNVVVDNNLGSDPGSP